MEVTIAYRSARYNYYYYSGIVPVASISVFHLPFKNLEKWFSVTRGEKVFRISIIPYFVPATYMSLLKMIPHTPSETLIGGSF